MNLRRNWIYLLIIALLPFALLINLGLMTFIDDEGIRTLVALEMMLSGNYITPTLHGDFYYNKPPLYNWLLVLFFELSGQVNEWTARLPNVLSLLAFGGTVYYFFQKHYSRKIAFINALALISCGRILFWDSMLALIDIGFSWVVFTSFMVIYHQFEKGKYWKLFLISYLLISVAFMMKGLPALVFQGVTLLVYFAYRRRLLKLFHPAHFTGILLFVLIVGGYYLAYSYYNGLDVLMENLVWESFKRTPVNYGWTDTLLHLFSFPLEMVYHFLPWSLMGVYFFRKKMIRIIRQDAFVTFNLIIFLANILVYWASPEAYPRYLFMLAPLFFSALIHLHYYHKEHNTWQFRLLHHFFWTIILMAGIGSFAPLFLERLDWIPWRIPKAVVLGLALLGVGYGYKKWNEQGLLWLILALLLIRIGFNWFVLPDRNMNGYDNLCRISSKRVGRDFKDYEMYLYKDLEMQMTNSVYITMERGEIVMRKWEEFDPDAVYLINPAFETEFRYDRLDNFLVRKGRITYSVVQPK